MKLALVIIASIAMVLVLCVAWGVFFSRRRKRALTEVARQLGWTLHVGGLKLAATPCFSGRSNPRIDNAMEGRASGLHALMFDYLFEEEVSSPDGGDSTVIRTVTVAVFSSPHHQLPSFALKKKIMIRGVRDRVEVAGQPELLKRLVLTGKDKASISSLFDPQLVSFLSSASLSERLCLEGEGPWLVFYYENAFGQGKRLSARQWAGFLQETSLIAGGIFQIAAKAAPSSVTSAA